MRSVAQVDWQLLQFFLPHLCGLSSPKAHTENFRRFKMFLHLGVKVEQSIWIYWQVYFCISLLIYSATIPSNHSNARFNFNTAIFKWSFEARPALCDCKSKMNNDAILTVLNPKMWTCLILLRSIFSHCFIPCKNKAEPKA